MIGRTILTAEEMREAEQRAIAAGTPVEHLMERAGRGAADAIWRFAAPMPALVLCGPGNNGGDGYVVARALAERGIPVAVAALGESRSAAAIAARSRWTGPVAPLSDAGPAPLLVDALFGTGLSRGLDEQVSAALGSLAAAATVSVAIDLPSGVSTDSGEILSPVPAFDLTVTFATLKPAHRLQPAAGMMGRVVVANIGIEATSMLREIGRPKLRTPGPRDHKYSRGYVAVVGGEMPGAAALSVSAAARAGAGYVRLASAEHLSGVPLSVVQSAGSGMDWIEDPRIDAVVAGPGLGRGAPAREVLERILALRHPLILDADALHLLGEQGPERLSNLPEQPILTPHAGEFERLFGKLQGSKVEQARAAAAKSGAVVLFKGADTVVAAPDGRAAISAPAMPWLASAGTGDVLSGIAGAVRASGLAAFEAACAATWLHARAAELAGPGLIADDLIGRLPTALAACSE